MPARVPGPAGAARDVRHLPGTRAGGRGDACSPSAGYGVDAAILFSDIVVPLAAVGIEIDAAARVPSSTEPFRSAADLARLRPLEPEADMPYVLETVRLLAGELDVPLIGFAGAPFTLASYLIEGGPSQDATAAPRRSCTPTRSSGPTSSTAWPTSSVASLRAQVEAGAAAVQVFDSWAGLLSPADYRPLRAARHPQGLRRPRRPRRAPHPLRRRHRRAAGAAWPRPGADVVGVDWRVPLDRARARLGDGVAVQGNLDPAVCLAPWDVVAREAGAVLAANAGRPGPRVQPGLGRATRDRPRHPAPAGRLRPR